MLKTVLESSVHICEPHVFTLAGTAYKLVASSPFESSGDDRVWFKGLPAQSQSIYSYAAPRYYQACSNIAQLARSPAPALYAPLA